MLDEETEKKLNDSLNESIAYLTTDEIHKTNTIPFNRRPQGSRT